MLASRMLALVTLLSAHALGFTPDRRLPRRAVLLAAPAISATPAMSSTDGSSGSSGSSGGGGGGGSSSSKISSGGGGGGGTSCFAFSLTSVEISGVIVPVAVWRPAAAGSAVLPPSYPYSIDIGKIAAKLRIGWLGWLPKRDSALPCGAAPPAPLEGFGRARDGDAILFAHGFLGSVYDFAHAAEALASDGFTVVAPELPESLCASYIPPDGLGREATIAAPN